MSDKIRFFFSFIETKYFEYLECYIKYVNNK